MSIPAHHSTGDTGHVADHNLIADALTAHEASLSTLSNTSANAFLTTGANTVTVTGTTTTWARINLPAGDRSSAVDTFAVYYSTRKIFALSGYGDVRVNAADPARTPLIIGPYSASQTADLTQWTDANGAALAGIRADGTIYAPNITPGGWTTLALKSGFRAYNVSGDIGFTPAYRVTGKEITFRGVVAKTDGTAFATGTPFATLSSSLAPASQINHVCPSGLTSGSMWSVRLDVGGTDGKGVGVGNMVPRLTTGYGGSGVPNWISLDGLTYEIA